MFEYETVVADSAHHIFEDENSALQHNARAISEKPMNASDCSWLFTYNQIMPASESLIPFRI